MQIGFVGLGRMGGNMVHRIHRDSDHEVVAFDFATRRSRRRRGPRRHAARPRSRTSSAKLDAPRTVWIMVPAGEPTQETVDALAELLERRRHDRRRRQLEVDRRQGARRRRCASTASTTSTSARAAASGASRSATA